MKALLVQWCRPSDHVKLLRVAYPVHEAYCKRHNIEYKCLVDVVQGERHLFWDKVKLIQMALLQDWEYIVYLDADCLLVNHEVDFRGAVPDGKWIGMTEHFSGLPVQHYNAGAIHIRNCQKAHEFFEAVWNNYPLKYDPFGWHDQTAINELLQSPEWRDGLEVLGNEWNSHLNGYSENPVVVAWHGIQGPIERCEMMKAEVVKRGL
jgi:glycosyl transferase family (putative galactosyltransferase)